MEKLHNLINSKKIVGILLVFILLQGCKTEKKNSIKEIKKEDVIEITTNVMDFQSVDTISSGWTTFKYINNSNEPHFFLLEKYPANKSIDDGRIEVFPVFQNEMDELGRFKRAYISCSRGNYIFGRSQRYAGWEHWIFPSKS